jgi:glycine cleavage system aminomethyltransferase T
MTGTSTSDVTVRATMPPLRSPLSSTHTALGAVLGVEDGAEFVRSYTDSAGESAALDEHVGIADITVRGKIDLRGSIGPALGSAGDSLVSIADDWALVFLPPGPVADRVTAMQAAVVDAGMATDVTHLYAGFALAGPLLADLVARLTSWDLSTLVTGEATGAPFADVRAVVVRRDAAVPLIEVYVAMEFAGYVWRSFVEVAGRLGGCPVGWDALREKGWR